MFDSIYSDQLSQYYGLRRETLSESAEKHELCYLRRFDSYVSERLDSPGHITEDFINEWVGSLSGKSSSVENKIIVIRQFLEFLKHTGESVAMPSIPRVHDDYVPYIFSDTELNCIFESADNIVQKDPKADPYLVIEFPVILRLLYSCGLRIGETVKISMNDVDLDGGILRLINTKGNKQRLVPMSAPMTDILYKYCLAMNFIGRNNIWLFPSSKNEGHISDRSVKHRFEYILRNNGIQVCNRKKHERGPCLHCMRHVFAFKSFAKAEREGRHFDDAVPFLSVYLGHAGINETAKYLKFSNELFPESIDSFGRFMSDLLPEVNYEE